MQIQKSQLEAFYQAVKGTEGVLSLKESRVRDSFLKVLTPETQTYGEDKLKIYEKFSIKKEGDTFHFPPEDVAEVNKELKLLMDETVELPVPHEIKAFLERTTYKPKEGEADILDDIISKI